MANVKQLADEVEDLIRLNHERRDLDFGKSFPGMTAIIARVVRETSLRSAVRTELVDRAVKPTLRRAS